MRRGRSLKLNFRLLPEDFCFLNGAEYNVGYRKLPVIPSKLST